MSLKSETINIFSFDGQTVWIDRQTELFEVGNFLGGGAAGNVYECEHVQSHLHYAMKILNPLGYKIISSAVLRKCNVITKGKVFCDTDKSYTPLKLENVWWLQSSTKQYIAAYFSERCGSLRELSLSQCILLWGKDSLVSGQDSYTDSGFVPVVPGSKTFVPVVPPKFMDFLKRRSRIFREIHNMEKINDHINVIKLEGVLELIQESKCTIFLVLELANGGELFDRIKLDCGAREETANIFFQQLLQGVKHCHDQGVCHRDLKPENLLLQDNGGSGTVLKIADFGFSARFAKSFELHEDHSVDETSNLMCGTSFDSIRGIVSETVDWTGSEKYEFSSTSLSAQPRNDLSTGLSVTPCSSLPEEMSSSLRVLKSVVGSPFYVAPEVMQACGYDGPKADVWSLGVILYAMLAGNLPFGQELSICKRFRQFCKWVKDISIQGVDFMNSFQNIDFPVWLFPEKFSPVAKGLIVLMLHPNPELRISVSDAMIFSSQFVKVDQKEEKVVVETVIEKDLESDFAFHSSMKEAHNSPDSVYESNSHNDINCNGEIAVLTQLPIAGSLVARQQEAQQSHEEEGMFQMEDDEEFNRIRSTEFPSTVIHLDNNLTAYSQPLQRERLGNVNMRDSFSTVSNCATATVFDCVNVASPSPPVPPLFVLQSLRNEVIDNLLCEDRSLNTELSKLVCVDNVHNVPQQTSTKNGTPYINPPSFCENVKRSTRFVTTVPPVVVLENIEAILEYVRFHRIFTSAGFIGKVSLDWERYAIEIWGLDTLGPSVCTVFMYQMPYDGMDPQINRQREAFLIDFVRGQVEIFAFKRFYQWIREQLSKLVQQDFTAVGRTTATTLSSVELS